MGGSDWGGSVVDGGQGAVAGRCAGALCEYLRVPLSFAVAGSLTTP
ncbi:hypothetical protein [Actinomadura decatromicini]|nr:hypothetical protein [Actinomadura decatromicini]